MQESDAAVFAEWASDERFCQHAGWTFGGAPAATLAFWTQLIAAPPADLLRLTAIADGEVAGYVDLHGDLPGVRELGYVVGPSTRWGRGLGTALGAAGLAHAFDVLGLEAVWAEALAANVPSVRILRTLGMRETGRGDAEAFLGEPTHYVQFRLSRVDWRRSAAVFAPSSDPSSRPA